MACGACALCLDFTSTKEMRETRLFAYNIAVYHGIGNLIVDVARSNQESLPQSRDGNLKIEEWRPSVWEPVKLPAFRYESSLLDNGAARSQGRKEATACFDACKCNRKSLKAEVESRKDIIFENSDDVESFRSINICLQMAESQDEKSVIPLSKAHSGLETPKDEWVYQHIIERGLESDPYISYTLIDMYVKCGNLEKAESAFESLPTRLVETWNALITGYNHYQKGYEGVKLFKKMQQEGVEPSRVTFLCVLKACSNSADLDEGRRVHACVIECGFEFAMFIENALIDMYVKCESLDDACAMFARSSKPDVTSFNTLIGGYAEDGNLKPALCLFRSMQLKGISYDQDILSMVLLRKHCHYWTECKMRHIHACIIEHGMEHDTYVGNSLVNMYFDCECSADAVEVFNKMPQRGIVTWNTLITGFVQHGKNFEALQGYWQMHSERLVQPDSVTFVCALKSCLGSGLIEMYVKFGQLEDACRVFSSLPEQNVVTWNILLKGFSDNGQANKTLELLFLMQEDGLEPDAVTLICTIKACSRIGALQQGNLLHIRSVLLGLDMDLSVGNSLISIRGGFVDEGVMHFKSMIDSLGLQPTVEHYNPLVDVLGGVGALHEAEDLLETLPFEKNMVGWVTLLSASGEHSNEIVARRCFDHVVEIDPANASAYVIMSNTYNRAGQVEEAQSVEELRKLANAWKKPAKAFIEIDRQVHEFTVGDRTHPQRDAVYTKMNSLNAQLKKEGYRPKLDSVMNFSATADKEKALCSHSEKLAIAFGLISSSPFTTLRVSKNLRMCDDCHVVTKLISRMETRSIIVKDSFCVHQFQEGVCSCEG
ncbi:hypothetical protein GOP47_0006367 [Adiantum capillus-veneris]|uniref:DYW domain-containing protein n=1 Tax=Adiantum capillus-veneris TaxID=13818 RepID=A0A9D4V3G4_ADICA|nr:hypothetical protein GOP47_0006367 [Adiantum capillus-veneris]